MIAFLHCLRETLGHMQMFYDDLPIWGFIGKVEKIMSQSTKSWEKHELKYYLFTHIHFDILYNGDRVIEVNVSTDPSRTVEITEGENVIVDWTYSVKWRETSIPFEKRMDKYARYSFLPQHLEVGRMYFGLVLVPARVLAHICDMSQSSFWGCKLGGASMCLARLSTGLTYLKGILMLQGCAHVRGCEGNCACADPLVLHHQQLCDGVAADRLPSHHSHACPQE